MLQTKTKKAIAEIETAWANEPGSSLLRTFLAAVAGESALEQARRVEKLVASNADHAESRLAVAQVSLRAQLWGQARNRLAPLLGNDVAKKIQARAALLMAELESAERNDAAAGASWLKRALELGEQYTAAVQRPRTAAQLLALSG